MTTVDLFRRIVTNLDQAGIAYMLTGSFASAYHGAPRATQDIDLVITATPEQLRRLVALLPASEYFVDLGAALEAHRNQGQFNVIDLTTGWKIDLIIRKSRPFSTEEFERRETVEFQGLKLAVITVEDLNIAKLEWAKLGESQRQLDDVALLLQARARELDQHYVDTWVQRLELEQQWTTARRRVGR